VQQTEEKPRQNFVGQPVRRKEALPLLVGEGIYTDDLALPVKIYHVAFLRSPYAHARMKSIDASEALKLRGVIAVFSGQDFKQYSMGYWMHLPYLRKPKRFPLAIEKVKYHGEALAAVVAEDKYTAEDALELINVEYEPLPVITDPLQALENDSVKVHDDLANNVIAAEEYQTSEDVQSQIDSSPLVIEEVFRNGRTSPAPLETRMHVAYFDNDRLTIWSSTQCPHLVRAYAAETLDFPENKIRIIGLNVGGSFGPKTNTYPDEIALYAIALKLKLPVKWIETRTENLLTSGHERDQVHFVKAGFTKRGKIIGVYDRVVADVGTGGLFWTELLQLARSTTCLPGPYKFSLYGFNVKGVATNKAPWAANIGFGRPPGTFVIERLMDIAANKLRMDPSEIRRINLVTKDEFPYKNPAGVVYDSGDYPKGLRLLLQSMEYEKLREEQRKLRERGTYIGIGLSVYCETSASSMSWFQGKGYDLGGHEKTIVRITPTGKGLVMSGSADQGQGQKTIFAQVAADYLGLDVDDVDVVLGDTDVTPYSPGTFNSRSTVTVSNSIIIASKKIADKVRRIAAYELKVKPEEIVLEKGIASVRNDESRRQMSYPEIAKIAHRMTTRLPPGEEPYLEESALYDPPANRNFISYGWHGAVVKVDKNTGRIEVMKYYIVDDAGIIINPLTAEGQIEGGVIGQGMLQTFRELKYDENGILLASSFLDYHPPTAPEIPSVFKMERMVTPSPTPSGFKGIGEGCAQGSPAALVNGVADALIPLGVKITRLPLSWGDVWEKINSARQTVMEK
jgi:aerobic carbon-monoxide dehydrogenase large subunit